MKVCCAECDHHRPLMVSCFPLSNTIKIYRKCTKSIWRDWKEIYRIGNQIIIPDVNEASWYVDKLSCRTTFVGYNSLALDAGESSSKIKLHPAEECDRTCEAKSRIGAWLIARENIKAWIMYFISRCSNHLKNHRNRISSRLCAVELAGMRWCGDANRLPLPRIGLVHSSITMHPKLCLFI